MLAGQFALLLAGLFTGAALYINVAEHPARLKLSDEALLAQWKPAYKRGYAMQLPLVLAGSLCGFLAWWTSGANLWLVGALVLLANAPYTLVFIAPTNASLMATASAEAGPASRAMLLSWGRLHAVRAALGAAAALAFLIASLR